jgi:hypothetical protein
VLPDPQLSVRPHMRTRDRQSGLAWIEVVLIVAIFVLTASLFFRLWYRQRWLAAENSVVQSLAIDQTVYVICKIAVLTLGLVCLVIYRIRRGRPPQ